MQVACGESAGNIPPRVNFLNFPPRPRAPPGGPPGAMIPIFVRMICAKDNDLEMYDRLCEVETLDLSGDP